MAEGAITLHVSSKLLALPLILLCSTTGALVSACGAPPIVATALRDSADVVIAENPSRVSAPAVFSVSENAVLDAGGLSGDPAREFTAYPGSLHAARLDDGLLAVADGPYIKVFTSDGAFLRVQGTLGKGPAETEFLTALCQVGRDTLMTHDAGNHRWVLFTSEVGVAAVFAEGTAAPPQQGCLGDGTVIGVSLAPQHRDPQHLSLDVVRLDTRGKAINAIQEVSQSAVDITHPVVGYVAASGLRIYVGDPNSGEVRIYTPDGKMVRIVRTDDKPVKVKSADLEARLRARIPTNLSPAAADARFERIKRMPHSKTWPAMGRIVIDPASRLWIEDFRISREQPQGWTAFDSTGRLIGRLMLPAVIGGDASPVVLGFGNKDIMIGRRDSDGATHVSIYPLVHLKADSGGTVRK